MSPPLPWQGAACALLFVVACATGDVTADPVSPATHETRPYTLLDDQDQLTRASLALRGLRPSLEDHARLEEDPEALDELVAGYAQSDAFVEVMLEWANEVFLVRTDTIPLPPALGALAGFEQGAIYRSATEEPLKLLEHILVEDRPLTELVTADYMLADEIVAQMWGVPWEPSGSEWQVSHWTDGRPAAGILSSAWMMYRYQSAGNNFHRARADMLADALLCQSFNTRDIVVGAEVNIADEAAVAEAVATDPACIACHQSMDPLAGYFWGYKGQFRRSQITLAHTAHDCYWPFVDGEPVPTTFDSDPADYCYPLRQYFADEQTLWDDLGLREPSYFSDPARDMTDVGQLIADDPRFSRCMASRVFGFLAATDLEEAPPELVVELQQTLEDSHFDLRELAVAVVSSDAFRASGPGGDEGEEPPYAQMRPLRPSQFARSLHQLTGYRWLANPDSSSCTSGEEGNTCWRSVDLLESDLFGFRSMQGGIDSFYTLTPDHTLSPTRFLTVEVVSWDAARFVVDTDLAEPDPTQRLLLTQVSATDVDPDLVHSQLAELFLRMHGTTLASDDPEVERLYSVFEQTVAEGDPSDAWTLTIAALLQAPGTLFY